MDLHPALSRCHAAPRRSSRLCLGVNWFHAFHHHCCQLQLHMLSPAAKCKVSADSMRHALSAVRLASVFSVLLSITTCVAQTASGKTNLMASAEVLSLSSPAFLPPHARLELDSCVPNPCGGFSTCRDLTSAQQIATSSPRNYVCDCLSGYQVLQALPYLAAASLITVL